MKKSLQPLGSQAGLDSNTPCLLLDKSQVSGQLGISIRMLEALVSNRQFPPGVRLGRRLLWDSRVAESWREQQFSAQLQWMPGHARS